MLLLGIDIGTSSVKVAVVDGQTQNVITTAQHPETEYPITSIHPGWAEQNPEMWWQHVQVAILKAHAQNLYDPAGIKAIGIAYQMHGLVCVDKNQEALRDSIIWCDSRAVAIGNDAFDAIGHQHCLSHLLNSPGNFTASKLAWVKQNQPAIFEKIDKVMLPGDFIAMKITGESTTSVSALSEGIFWDFKRNELSKDVFSYFGFDSSIIPEIKDLFSTHGTVSAAIANRLSVPVGIPVSYKAGDQPNNALSLNVLNPGEVAATAGTSGVIYGVSDKLTHDRQSRINSFAHVNYDALQKRIGVLLCINGTGILNSWVKKVTGNKLGYSEMNVLAKQIKPGSNGLMMMPFGNGAERILNNKIVNSHIHGIDLNIHTAAHLYRAAQEGIAFAFRYGLDIMKENGMEVSVIRVGKANMFLSDVFTEAFVNANGVPVEMYEVDGSIGAAIGAGIGATLYATPEEAFGNIMPLSLTEPANAVVYNNLYHQWKDSLENDLKMLNLA